MKSRIEKDVNLLKMYIKKVECNDNDFDEVMHHLFLKEMCEKYIHSFSKTYADELSSAYKPYTT